MTTREQLIFDLTNNYKKKHPTEYKAICKDVRAKQQKLLDRKSGVVKSGKMRAAVRVPQTLFAWLDGVLDNPRFLEDSEEGTKELRWFLSKFPEFKIPNEY